MSTIITMPPAAPATLIPIQAQPINTQGISVVESIAKIGDIIRGSLLTNRLEQIPLLLRSVTEQVTKKGGRLYLKNFWSDPKPLSLGYVGVHIKIRMPIPPVKTNLAGTVEKTHKYILMELQIHPKQIMDGTKDCAKEIAHRIYKMPRGVEETASSDLISSSQLMYLTSMVKLLCGSEELERTANTLELIQAVTKANKQMRLVLETALLLHNERLCHGEWSEKLQAIVPKNKDAVETTWIATALKINKILNLPVVKADDNDSWSNTAISVDELHADAMQIAPFFEKMCRKAAKRNPDCSVNFGPGNKHMIKDMKSLQIKINKDRNPHMILPECIEGEEKHKMSCLDNDQKTSQDPSKQFQQIHAPKTTQAKRLLASYYPRLQKEIDFVKIASSSSFKMAHSHFSGRTKNLASLKAHLTVSSPFTRVQILYGPGGVGKSELAITFANQSIDNFSFIWSISCGTDEEHLTGYNGLAKRLEIPMDEKESLSSLMNKVHRKLEKNRSKPWLLLLDNLQMSSEPPSFPSVPSRRGSILITSYKNLNIQSLPPGAAIATEILPLEPEEALQFLETVTEKPANDCKKLLSHIGCYPLVLGQVASYIKHTGIEVEEYLATLEQSQAVPAGHDNPFKTPKIALEPAFNMTLQQLFPSAKKWLFLCSQLNAALIPVSYLKAWLDSENISEEQAAIIATLEEHALLRYNAQEKVFSMHLEFQRILKTLALVDTVGQAAHLLVTMRKEWDFDNTNNWGETMKKATIWASHAEPFFEASGRILYSLERHRLLDGLSEWEYQNGHDEKALAYCDQSVTETLKQLNGEALKVTKAAFGENHYTEAGILEGMADCYRSQSNYTEALKLYGEAFKIRRAALGENHPDVAPSLIGIGHCYKFQKNYTEALKLYGEALKIKRAALRENHPDIAEILNSIGFCYERQGNYSEALKVHGEALKIGRTTFGENHPAVAKSLDVIGTCYISQGNYTEALKLYGEALKIRRTTFGENHPAVATSLNVVGTCYYSQGNYAEALKMYGEELKIRRTTFGENHPAVATSLNVIGTCYISQGNYAEALKMYGEELKIKRATLGENHPDVAMNLHNIGHCYYFQGKYAEALKMYREELKIKKATLGENHPDVATNLSIIEQLQADLNPPPQPSEVKPR